MNSVAFSPDEKFILTGSGDGIVRLWSYDGKLKQFFKGHEDDVTFLAFSSNGKFIITGSDDNTARLWRPFWEIISPDNTYIPSPEKMREYDIPENIEGGMCGD